MARISQKRIQIDKANARIVGFLAAASFVVVFSLISIKALVSQSGYQNRVINEKEKAVNQLRDNIAAVDKLEASFETFDTSVSVLGNSDKNAKIVLDALPSKYDFPALVTSVEKMLAGFKIEAISGTDDEANQNATTGTLNPRPVEMPMSVSASSTYPAVQKLVADFGRSIRPFSIDTIILTGNEADMRVAMDMRTYYQPKKNLNITTKIVK